MSVDLVFTMLGALGGLSGIILAIYRGRAMLEQARATRILAERVDPEKISFRYR